MGHDSRSNTGQRAWMVMLLSLTLVSTAQAVDMDFKGFLVEEACSIRPGDDVITVDFGEVNSKYLYNNTRSIGKEFDLHLENCDTSIGNTVTITISGIESGPLQGLLELASGSAASGVAIGLETLTQHPLPINTVSDEQILTNGNNVISFKAYVQGEPLAIMNKTIVAGMFSATSTFKLDYP